MSAGGLAVGTSAAYAVLLTGLSLLAPTAGADSPAQDEFMLGQALFTGKVDLHGRIYTHETDLPPAVVRCANCHGVTGGPDAVGSLAPRLNHDLLLRPLARRGGPASSYDRDGFCTLLRRGIDPARVLISVEMPRYSIDDASCWALWQYLISNEPAQTRH